MTVADVAYLNNHVVQIFLLNEGLDGFCITRANQRRHMVNQLQIRPFAEARGSGCPYISC